MLADPLFSYIWVQQSMYASISSALVSSQLKSHIPVLFFAEGGMFIIFLYNNFAERSIYKQTEVIFLDTCDRKIIGWSLKITKGFHVLKFQGLITFQISCLLCGWGITTISMNNFTAFVSSCLSLLCYSSSSLYDARELLLSDPSSKILYTALSLTGLMHTQYLRCRSHGLGLSLQNNSWWQRDFVFRVMSELLFINHWVKRLYSEQVMLSTVQEVCNFIRTQIICQQMMYKWTSGLRVLLSI